MNRILLLIVFLLMANIACNSQKDKNKDVSFDTQWSALTIFSENYRAITIYYEPADTAMMVEYNRGSFFAPMPRSKWHDDTTRLYFTQVEKDAIFRLANDLILHPARPKQFCTDYVGELELTINYPQFRQSAQYTSVCDWS